MNLAVGNTYSEACYYPFYRTFYQTQSYPQPEQAKYRYEASCNSQSCDWSCYVSWVFWNSIAYDCCNFCGLGSGYFCAYSDETLKSGIKTIQDALPKLMEFDAVEYDWNEKLSNNVYEYLKRKNKLHTIGLIAQNVRKYFPEVVKMNMDGYYHIEYEKLNAVLVEAIKAQQVFIDDIKTELDWIENKIN
jgi:hypothetical protein